ncbi:hypothetical protein [Fodinibius salsisoli]|uniref:Collagen triple helix repeat-containing protein n=1 Tax=Fodinibius salsisoli TaxID=2820877 RepID=A0ABT3PNZ9_9BACT|nr:hypothetical protein [Fodinibius salsisoli]MCW9707591.1 hypothetical protein [Fodinibius salsisoli]
MKYLSLIFSVLLFVGCQGERGPVGPEGPPGGSGPIGQGFGVEATFNANNNYSQQFFFSDYGAEAFSSDIIVVYWKYGEDEQTGNGIWQQLPATIYFDDGQFQYSFDHTVDDVQLFLQGNIDLGTLGSGYTQNQDFWVAILPVEFVESNNVDLNNFQEVRGIVDPKSIQELQPVK